jgi:hypothetical protein
MELSRQEKLNLINGIVIEEVSGSCGELEYVLAENNETNRSILHQLGMTDEDIEKECYPEEDYIDISYVAFARADADFYGGKLKKFI